MKTTWAKRQVVGAVLGVVLGLGTAAQAQMDSSSGNTLGTGSSGFGRAGSLVISSDMSAAIGYRSFQDAGQFYFLAAPAADYFLQQNLSLGGQVIFGVAVNEGPNDAVAAGALLRAGYNLPLAGALSFWPRVGLGVVNDAVPTLGSGAREPVNSGAHFTMDVFAPVLLHPASNFFLGGGPALAVYAGDFDGFDVGLRLTLGGHF